MAFNEDEDEDDEDEDEDEDEEEEDTAAAAAAVAVAVRSASPRGVRGNVVKASTTAPARAASAGSRYRSRWSR